MKITEEQIRAEANSNFFTNPHEDSAFQSGFYVGAKWVLSQDSTIEKVKELRDEICTLIHNWSGYRCLDSQINEIFERYINKQ